MSHSILGEKMKIYILAFIVAGLLLSAGCVGEPTKPSNSNATGEASARSWLTSRAPTYLYDATPSSLKLESSQILSSGCSEYVYSYQSTHAGFGNRSGMMMAQMLTSHNTTLHVCDGQVGWANTDGVYDEIRSTDICMMLSAIIEVCGADNKTYQHPCFAKAKGISIIHEGACAAANASDGDGSQLANPASEFCVKQGGTLTIEDEPNGQVGFCTLPTGTRVEEWNYFRANGNLSEPIACTMEYAPVCGSDKQTYSNTCMAHAAGASVKYVGECTTGPSTMPALNTKEWCKNAGGNWGVDMRDCAKANAEGHPCDPDPSRMVCQCGGFAGFRCPSGFACGDYLPSATTPDAMGTCLRVGVDMP